MKILLSDLHFAPFRAEKFLTQKKNFIEKIILFFAKILVKKEGNLFRKMEKIAKEEEVKLIISNGDLFESVATERGIATARDLEAGKKILADLEKSLKVKLKLNLGNHESGYVLPLSTDPEGGMSKRSIGNFLRLTKRKKMYHSFSAEGFYFIFVPYLFTESFAKDFNLRKMKRKFLAEMKRELKVPPGPIIVFIHDPDSMMDQELYKIIKKGKEEKKIKAIFYGHYHSELNLFFARALIRIFNSTFFILPRTILNILFWIISGRNMRIVRELGKYFRSRKDIPGKIKEIGATLIPAPTGMFGIGGGFLTLKLHEDGNFQIKKYKK